MMCRFVLWSRKVAPAPLLGLFLVISMAAQAQEDGLKAVPILTGSTAYFTRVTAGQYQDAPSVRPLLLVPVSDKCLFEANGSYSDTFTQNKLDDHNFLIAYGLCY